MIPKKYYDELKNKQIHISEEADVDNEAIILFNSVILGKSKIEKNAVIGPNTIIIDSLISEGAQVINSYVVDSYIGVNTTVGPFANIKSNSSIGDGCRIGNFVEVKNSQIMNQTKAAHLAYIGDAYVGARTNFGCGSITVNYDGKNKHQTTIGDDVFIGSNSNLIAPITISNSSFIACGSTITEDVPNHTLSIARSRQINKVDYFKNNNTK